MVICNCSFQIQFTSISLINSRVKENKYTPPPQKEPISEVIEALDSDNI